MKIFTRGDNLNQAKEAFILFVAPFLLVLCPSKTNANLFLAASSVSYESRIVADTPSDVDCNAGRAEDHTVRKGSGDACDTLISASGMQYQDIAAQTDPVRLLVQDEQPDRISKSTTFSHTMISENIMDHQAIEAIADSHLPALGPKEACGTYGTDPSENNIVEVSGVTLTRTPESATMFLLGFGLIVLGHMARTAARKRLTSGKEHAYFASLLKVISPGNHEAR